MSHHFFLSLSCLSVCFVSLFLSVYLPAYLSVCPSVYLLLLLVTGTKTMLSVPASSKMKIIFCPLVTSVLTCNKTREKMHWSAGTYTQHFLSTHCWNCWNRLHASSHVIFLGFKPQLRTHKNFKRTLFIRTITQSANFGGNPLRQATRWNLRILER